MSREFIAERVATLKPSGIRKFFDIVATMADVPGSAFGAGGSGFVRCSYATSYEKIEEALDRIESFVNRCG